MKLQQLSEFGFWRQIQVQLNVNIRCQLRDGLQAQLRNHRRDRLLNQLGNQLYFLAIK